MSECPFIKRDFVPTPAFNERRVYEAADGTEYVYYHHFDGFDQYYPCQFCVHIGRKRDVFECLNEGEWHNCWYYQSEMSRSGKEQA